MKNKFFFCYVLIAYLCVCSTIVGQQTLSEVTYPNHIVDEIIHTTTYNSSTATVSYMDMDTARCFSYADNSYSVINLWLPPAIKVSDFKIIDDSWVVFCGSDTTPMATKAVLGLFKIANFFSTSPTYLIYDNFLFGSDTVRYLHSLVAYQESNIYHIVMTGTLGNEATGPSALVLDLTAQNMGSSWNYETGISSLTGETLTNICLTDKYVVTAGNYDQSLYSETYRVHKRSDIFMTGGTENTIHHFTPNLGFPYSHNYRGFKMTHMTEDTIAVANYYTKPTSPTNLNAVLFVFNVGDFVNYPSTQTAYLWTLSLTTSSFTINDLVYNDNSRRLALLVEGQLLYSAQSMILDIPVSSTIINYSAVNFDDVSIKTADKFGMNYVAQGISIANDHVSVFFSKPFGTPSLCKPDNLLPIVNYWNDSKQFDAPFIIKSNTIVCTEVDFPNKSFAPKEVICNQKRQSERQ